MVITPITNIPKYNESNDNLLGKTQRPSIGQPQNLLPSKDNTNIIAIPQEPTLDATIDPFNVITIIPKTDRIVTQTGGAIVPPYVFVFTTVDWQEIIANTLYEIQIPFDTHNKGKNPFVLIYEEYSGGFIKVLPNEIIMSNAGDVTIQSSTPINGKLVVYS